eukprot:2108164-Pleurochrysis_carterae.AAC.1
MIYFLTGRRLQLGAAIKGLLKFAGVGAQIRGRLAIAGGRRVGGCGRGCARGGACWPGTLYNPDRQAQDVRGGSAR